MTSTVDLVGSSVESIAPRGKHSKLTQYIAAFSATLGAFALGTVLAWTSPTQKSIESGYYGFEVTPDEFAWIGSLLTIGAAASTIPTGILVDLIGRKYTMLAVALPFAAGWALIAWPTGVGMIYAGRIITGFCGGVFSVASPLYIGEISEDDVRGTLGTAFQLMVVFGIEFTYVVGTYTSVLVISVICLIIPLLFAIIFFWMPETPQYHLKKEKADKAKLSLQWFRGGLHTTHNVDDELSEMKSILDSSIKVPLLKTFNTRAAKKAMLISSGLMFFQQLSGINAVIFYTTTIFGAAGTSVTAEASTMIVGAVQIVFTIIAAFVIDRLGRRILLLISFGVMSVCTLALGLSLHFIEKLQNEGEDTSSIGWIPLVALCLYIAAFSLGAGPIPWSILGELFATEIKGTASSLSALLNWSIAFIVTKFYPNLEAAIGPMTFFIFMGFLIVAVVFTFVIVPETKGKSLEEIQRELEDK